MKCIIVEDQSPAQRVLKKYIADIGSLDLQATFNNALDALEYLKKECVDLIFLDIHLPKLSGIDFLKTLQNPPAVILTTAFSDYAVQSYELDVVDYLVKPFSFERFVKAISKVSADREELQELLKPKSSFFIKSGHEYIKIHRDQIVFIQSDMDYTEIHLDEKRKLLSNETLSFWENKLVPHQFIRIHKSYLINAGKIEKVSGNQVYLTDDVTLPIGRAYKDAFVSKVIK